MKKIRKYFKKHPSKFAFTLNVLGFLFTINLFNTARNVYLELEALVNNAQLVYSESVSLVFDYYVSVLLPYLFYVIVLFSLAFIVNLIFNFINSKNSLVEEVTTEPSNNEISESAISEEMFIETDFLNSETTQTEISEYEPANAEDIQSTIIDQEAKD